MYLREALQVKSAHELDPSRPLQLLGFELGVEAAAEAVRILSGGEFPRDVNIEARDITQPFYWTVNHKTAGQAEILGFPVGTRQGLPTATEVALIRALAAATPDRHETILGGGAEISVGPPSASDHFRKIIRFTGQPMAGDSLLYNSSTQAIIDENIDTLLGKVPLDCLANSFRTSPLKFRFLELYRVMEARFLAKVKANLFSSFDAQPSAALNEAIEALKSEMNQILGLAETQKDAFEACWIALDQISNTNQFTAALFRTVKKKGHSSGEKWKTGTALIYQMRCAIVHAGERDMIFENFPDGDKAVETLLPHLERAALLLVGIEIL